MILMKIRKAFYAGTFLFVSLLITSCGVWRDFTVYFNTYYNAKTLFDQTEDAILKQKKDLFAFKDDQSKNAVTNTSQNPLQNQQYQQPQQGQQPQQYQQPVSSNSSQIGIQYISDLNKVIEKCSKILQYEKNSSYFEDALFITGKAFYYEGEFPKAQRKFIELSGISENKYELVNKLWLAKTHLQMRNFDEGLKLIEEVKADAVKAKDDKVYMDASITKIGFLIYREDYQKAIDECHEYLKVSKDDEVNALVSYELGKIYILVNDDQNALDSFNSALNYSPTFDIEFECRFESARLLKKLNKIDESAAAFENMRYQGKFKDKLDRILNELGQIYYDKKQPDKALAIFKDVDTTYKRNQTGGIACMKIAEIYQKEYRDYDSSFKYYNKAAVSNVTKEIKSEAERNSKTITNYFALIEKKKEFNSQIMYKAKPQYFYQDSVDYAVAYRQLQDKITKMTDSLKVADSQRGSLAQNYTFDQVSKIYIQQQEEFKLRRPALAKNADPQMLLIAKGIYKKPQKLTVSEDSLSTMISQNLYNIGSLFYSELDAPDSAFIYFKNILNNYPKKPVAPQAMFALGTYYETKNDTLKADSIFKYIYKNFEKDPIRVAAGQKLGLINQDDEDLSLKSRDPVEKSYVEAEQLVFDKKYQEAINSFQEIYKKSPKSVFASKSIYYCGMIYEENLKMYDSAAVEYGLLQNKEYANSAMAKAVSAKYQFYMAEKERLKAEAEKNAKEAAQKELELQKKENTAKENQDSLKTVKDTGQISGSKINAVQSDSKNTIVKQSVMKDSISVIDTLKKINQKPSFLKPKTVPDKQKSVRDSTKKIIDPL